MAALTIQTLVDAGTAPNFSTDTAAASQTASIGSGLNTFVVVKNGSASPINVTITAPGNTDYGQPNPDPVISVAATTGEAWIPLRRDYDDGTGFATIALSATTTVTIALVRLG